ncbi:MAG: IPT/TIG domain-containing protein, partial [Elusimicrobia bacterium]|nr:IPT/TIG domain-containing protein [Elusimicrobiota bacterium]
SAADPFSGGVASGAGATFFVIDADPFDPACEAVPVDPNAPAGTCANEGYAGPFTLAPGTHTVYYFSEDAVANQETPRVSSFTVIAAAPVAACGAPLTGSTTMTADLVCAGSGPDIVAAGTTLDCGGHAIVYGTSGAGVGVRVSSAAGVTVRDCFVRPATAAAGTWLALSASSADGLLVQSSTFTGSAELLGGTGAALRDDYFQYSLYTTEGDELVRVVGATAPVVAGSVLVAYGGNAGTKAAIHVEGATGGAVTGNTVYAHYRVSGVGLYGGADVTVSSNALSTGLDYAGGGVGVLVLGTERPTVTGNVIASRGTSVFSMGVNVSGGSGARVSSNTIDSDYVGIGFGVLYGPMATDGEVSSNTVVTRGAQAHGIQIASPGATPDRTRVLGNDVTIVNPPASQTSGIEFGGSNGSVIGNRVLTLAGYSRGLRLNVNGGDGGNVVSSNTITTLRDNSPGLWLSNRAQAAVANNVVTTYGGPASEALHGEFGSLGTVTDDALTAYGSPAVGMEYVTGLALARDVLVSSVAYLSLGQASTVSGVTLSSVVFQSSQSAVAFPGPVAAAAPVLVTTSTFALAFDQVRLSSPPFLAGAPAVVTFSGLSFSSPVARVDYADTGAFVDCPSTLCSGLTYAQGTLSFAVAHFTGYAGAEAASAAPAGLSLTALAPSSATAGATLSLTATGTGFDASAALALKRLDAAAGSWGAAGALATGRAMPGVVRLRDGRVLAAGGFSGDISSLSSVEVYDPASGAWTAAAPMAQSRYGMAFALLNDGRVLAAGGRQVTANSGQTDTAASEVYDPATNAWTPTGSLPQAVDAPQTFVRPDGKVLSAGGGFADGTHTAATALYDPAAGTWTAGPPMSTPRISGAGIALKDGRFLMVGGVANGPALSSAEVYDPATNAWSSAGAMASARTGHTLTLLPDGRVLAAGGAGPTAEVYDPATNAWTPAGSMSDDHSSGASLLVGGMAVVAGGSGAVAGGPMTAVDVYDPATNAWRLGPPLPTPRLFYTLEALSDGRALTAGGWNGATAPTATALLTPLTATIAATGIALADSAHLSGTVDLTGAATGYWDAAVTESGGRIASLPAAFRVLAGPAAPPTLATIVVTPSSATVTVGATRAFAATAYYTDGSSRTLAAGGGDWQTKTAMAHARLGPSGAYLNGKFYAFSGMTGDAEAYDPAANAWSAIAAPPLNLAYARAAALGGKIYVAGGCVGGDCGAATAQMWAYDPVADSWTQKASLPSPRFDMVFAELGGKLYSAGGFNAGFSPLNELAVYDPGSNAWTLAAAMPLSRAQSGGGAVNGKLIVAGGNGGGTANAQTMAYDPTVNAWSTRAALPVPVDVPGSAALDGRLYLIGGVNAIVLSPTSTATWVYDEAGDQWTLGPALAAGRYDPAAGAGAGTLFVAGGGDGNVASTALGTLTPAAGAAWSVDAPAVATVTAAGLATGLTAGTAHVVASSGAVSGSALLTVTPSTATPAGLSLTALAPSSATSGTTLSLAATGTGFDASAALSLRRWDLTVSSWSTTGALATARNLTQTVRLKDGRILAAGGMTGDVTSLASVELYDPATGAWTAAAPMAQSRYTYALALLSDGRVLAAGGRQNQNNSNQADTAAAEVYDPATNAWTATSAMLEALDFPLTFVRPDGKVLVAGGGYVNGSHTEKTELYDPATGTWTQGPPMSTARIVAAGTTLKDGRFLVSGGIANNPTLASAEVYDPATNAWTTVASMATARYGHTLTTLPDGRVLAAGGTPAAEIYDPASNAWTAAGAMRDDHNQGVAALVGGKVLVVGGSGALAGGPMATSDAYDLATGAWSAGPTLSTPRVFLALAQPADGRVLAIGGATGGYPTPALAGVERLSAPTATVAATGVAVADAQHLSGTVALTGAATGYWDAVVAESGGRVAELPAAFRVLAAPAPPPAALTLASVAPSSAATGTTASLTAVGTGFDATTTLALERAAVAQGTWSATGAFGQGRFLGYSTKLRDGRVLLVGGMVEGDARGLANADLYDPATGAWTAAAPMNQGREQFAGVRLADGRVLVTGGAGPSTAIVASAEVFDPAAGTWTTVAPMAHARADHQLALLPDGRVLAMGGWGGSTPLASAEIYDPAGNAWTAAPAMSAVRILASALVLRDGRVLISGDSGSSAADMTAEVYDPATGAWSPAGTMNAPRYEHQSALLPDGRVLVSGGSGRGTTQATAEVYDPAAGTWTPTGPLAVARYAHAMVLVNGTPLIVGGENQSTDVGTTEVYDAASNAWSAGPSLLATRTYPQAAALDDGRVLVAGGRHGLGGGTTLNTAELLTMPVTAIAATGVTVADAQHLTGVLDLSGAATGPWDAVARASGGRVARLGAGFRVLVNDALPPATTISFSTPSFVSSGAVVAISTRSSVTLTAVDPSSGTGVAATYYAVDASTPTVLYAGPFTLSSGTHTVYYRSIDAAGNAEAVSAATVGVYAGPFAGALSVSSGPIGAPLTLTGFGFGAYAGSSVSRLYFGASTAPVSVWNDAAIAATVPGLAAGDYPLTVVARVDGSTQSVSAGTFTVLTPSIASVAPSSGPIGVAFTLTGSAFGPYAGSATQVLLGGATTPISVWNDGLIVGTVPGVLAPGDHSVQVRRATADGGVALSNVSTFTVSGLAVTAVDPSTGPIGVSFTLRGAGFGTYNGANTQVLLGGATVAVSVWNDTTITGTVPALSTGAYALVVERVQGGSAAFSAPSTFTVTALTLGAPTPSAGPIGVARSRRCPRRPGRSGSPTR